MVKLPGEDVKEIETHTAGDRGLAALQKLVGGYIRMPWALDLGDKHKVQMFVNDEGQRLELAENLAIDYGMDGVQTIVGPVLFLGTMIGDGEDGNAPLTDVQAKAVRAFCKRFSA